MNKRFLSTKQAEHLYQLEVKPETTIFHWQQNKFIDEAPYTLGIQTQISHEAYNEIPAYDLWDILDILPGLVSMDGEEWTLNIDKRELLWRVSYRYYYSDKVSILFQCFNIELIDALYETLCWFNESKDSLCQKL